MNEYNYSHCKSTISLLVYFASTDPTYGWYLCTDVAAKVLNRCTLSDPDNADTVVFDYQFLEDFRRDNGNSEKRKYVHSISTIM